MNDKLYKYVKYWVVNPANKISTICAILRGSLYILYFKIFKRNVTIRFPFIAYESVTIEGAGTVFIDRNCSVFANSFYGLQIITLSNTSHVKIGKYCSLGGLTIRCRARVTLGDRVMTAYSLIQDIMIMDVRNRKKTDAKIICNSTSDITVGNNCWIGTETCLLCNTSIGDDSVIALGSVCHKTKVDDYCLASGNPVKRALPIERIQEYFKRSA